MHFVSSKKYLFTVFFTLLFYTASAQNSNNLIIITLDGMRWQEIFRGMDTALANDPAFNQEDSLYIYREYWDEDPVKRRKKLMPFLWKQVAVKGQIGGNRDVGNLVNCANPYWFSFPGYSEIFTGYPDTNIDRNDHPPNPNANVLEFFNRQPSLKDKVAAFGAWNAFDRILNERRAGFPVINAFDSMGGNSPNNNEKLINRMLKDSYRPWLDAECLDVFTHFGAIEYLKNKSPRVLYIAYGETDEWAHSGMYRSYLDAARQVDKWLEETWNWLQSAPRYKNRTTLFITADHGRGDAIKKEWTSHSNRIAGADQIWYAAMGIGIPAVGERKEESQIYQQQFAQTFARLMNLVFKADHPIAEKIPGLGN